MTDDRRIAAALRVLEGLDTAVLEQIAGMRTTRGRFGMLGDLARLYQAKAEAAQASSIDKPGRPPLR